MGYGIKPDQGKKLSIRAPWSVIPRKEYGWRKPSLVGSFVLYPPDNNKSDQE